MRTLILNLIAALSALFLVGCASGFLGSIETVEDLRAACEGNEPLDMEFDVFFPANTSSCDWGVGGNLEATSGVVAARWEQTETIAIPEGGVVCGLEFDFQGLDPSFEQTMQYDDHFLFNFNGVVLAASYGEMVDGFEVDDGLSLYDWDDLVSFPIELHGEIDPYCLGEEEGMSECTIPESETPGPISLSFAGGLVDQMALRALDQQEYSFQFVATGDDNDTDCSHADFEFTVTAPVLTD